MALEHGDWRARIEEEMDLLRRTRDELRVQIHLGATEAREAWADLEQLWTQAQGRVRRIGEATHAAADDVEDATALLLEELRHGYNRIKQAL